MAKQHKLRQYATSAALGALAFAAVAPAGAEVNIFDGEWHFSVTPYAWLPNANGSTSFDGPIGVARNMSADMDSSNFLSHLKFAAMITGEVRKGEWSVFTDYIYLSLDGQKSTVKEINGPFGRLSTAVDLGSSTTVKGDVWSLAGGYSAWRGKDGHLDVLAGTRYLNLDTTLDWNVDGALGVLPGRHGSVTFGRSVWDGIIGVKGEIRLGEDGKWFVPYYVDVGAGSHNTTWQALLGGGYRYGWGNVTLAWRSLSYRFTGGAQNADVRFSGPAIGATFLF